MWGQAIAGLPTRPEFYRHRGELLARLGKEREAVVVSGAAAGCVHVLASARQRGTPTQPPATCTCTQDFTTCVELPGCTPSARFSALLGRGRVKQHLGAPVAAAPAPPVLHGMPVCVRLLPTNAAAGAATACACACVCVCVCRGHGRRRHRLQTGPQSGAGGG